MGCEESERRLVLRIGILTSGGDAPGIPTASDRILASRLGTAAVEALADGETGVMVGNKGPRIERVPLEEVVSKEQPLDSDLYRMAEVLAELPE
jgi:6-phosphofructokinase